MYEPTTATSYVPRGDIFIVASNSYSFTVVSTNCTHNVDVHHSPRARKFREYIQRFADIAGCSFDEALRQLGRIGEFEVPKLPPPRMRQSLIASTIATAPRIPRLRVRTPGRSMRGHDGRRRYRPRRKIAKIYA